MTLKSLLGGAAVVALAMAFSAPAALAADPNKSTATPSTTSSTPSSDTSQMNNQTPQGSATGQASTTAKTQNGISLGSVDNPQQTLANAQLQDKSGMTIGTVKQVNLGSNGKVKDVFIDVNGKTVALQAAKLKFDKSNNILFTSMTQAEINALPQAKGI